MDTFDYQSSKYYNLKLESAGSYTVTVTAMDENDEKVTSSKVSFSVKESSSDDNDDNNSSTSDNRGIIAFLAAFICAIPYMTLSIKKKNNK